MEAIERILGYCCEVNEQQWEELVRVADEVGLRVSCGIKYTCPPKRRYARLDGNEVDGFMLERLRSTFGDAVTPFPDFLAKLKGEEKWQPKAGDMVEVNYTGRRWDTAIFIGPYEDLFVCKGVFECGSYSGLKSNQIRPIRPTLTLAEAEAKLNCKIIVQ
jgi:hypothetical protein